MTLREAISSIKVPVKEVNADSRLSNKIVYSKIVSQSNLLIQRESDALRLATDKSFFQTLLCEPLEEVPAIESCYGVRNKSVVFRTKLDLPDMYTDQTGPIFGLVTSIDSSKQILITSPESIIRAKSDTNSKYDKTVYGFFRDGKLYLADGRYRAVNLSGAFISDVSGRSKCNCSGETPGCSRLLDNQWVVPKKLEKVILDLVIQDFLKSYKALQEQNVMDKNPNT